MHGQKKSDNEIYLLIKYIKSVLWRVAKCLSYIEDARCLKVNFHLINVNRGDRGSTVVKLLCYKLEGRWFDPRECHLEFSIDIIHPIALWAWGRLSL